MTASAVTACIGGPVELESAGGAGTLVPRRSPVSVNGLRAFYPIRGAEGQRLLPGGSVRIPRWLYSLFGQGSHELRGVHEGYG